MTIGIEVLEAFAQLVLPVSFSKQHLQTNVELNSVIPAFLHRIEKFKFPILVSYDSYQAPALLSGYKNKNKK
jgi:hypothetical protein